MGEGAGCVCVGCLVGSGPDRASAVGEAVDLVGEKGSHDGKSISASLLLPAMWEPLPLIVYGYAIHPLSPSRRDTYSTPRNRLSTVTDADADELTFTNVVNLEVGDEVYAFEKYTPSPREPVDGIWYRGCVMHHRGSLAH